MASKLSRKPANPFQDLPTVTASKTFVGEEVVIHRGEKRAGNDPVVAKHHGAFLAGDLQPHELPNMWDDLRDPPPEHPPHVHIPPSIAPQRQVRSTVNVWFDGGFAPGSPGAKSGRPSGFGSAVRIGQIFDALAPVVRLHPEWFVWVERPVSLADIERIERLEDIPES
jgi:hypothetical protein